MRRQVHRSALHRREIRQLKRRLAAATELIETLSIHAQLHPASVSLFRAGIGRLASAVADSLRPKPKPEPPPETVTINPPFGIASTSTTVKP